MPTPCPICDRRRGKRFCPGLASSRWCKQGKSETICAPCCGEQRETTIDCPPHCTYLQSAHRYEGERPKRPKEMAFPKVEIRPDFLEEKAGLVAGLSLTLARAAGQHSGMHDPDALAALEALAQSYQTLDSGLYYQQAPAQPTAQGLYTALAEFLLQYGQEQQQKTGINLRPGEALQALVFLRRLGQLEANGRPLSRRFLDFLRRQLPPEPAAAQTSPLIVPGR